MKLGRWSTTPGSNNATPPDGFPEGQAASTLNDCARELMASIRTVFQDAQFFDQDLSPTFVNATNFTVPGDQTSAIHSGRRLKVFDASVMFATVVTASFTAVTTIQIATDSGSNLTNSLSSFAIALMSRTNSGFPQGLSISAANVNTLSLSANGSNLAKAWVRFDQTTTAATSPIIRSSYNVASVSRSATATFRVNFTTPMVDNNYLMMFTGPVFVSGIDAQFVSALAASCKFQVFTELSGVASVVDSIGKAYNIVFFR
jgi:hypothetical protein